MRCLNNMSFLLSSTQNATVLALFLSAAPTFVLPPLLPSAGHNQTSKRDERNIIISQKINVVSPRTEETNRARAATTTAAPAMGIGLRGGFGGGEQEEGEAPTTTGMSLDGASGPRFNRLMKTIMKILTKLKFEREICLNFLS